MLDTRLPMFALLALLWAPVPVRLRVRLQSASASSAELDAMGAALRRGFYSDTNVAPPAETVAVRPGVAFPADSAWLRRGRTVFIAGAVETRGDLVEVRLRLLNVLTQPMAAPETLRIRRAELDSALATAGRAYASTIARQIARSR